MGYKRIEPNMTFAEVSLMSSMEHNRSLKRLDKINSVIDWSKVEEVLMAHYSVGTSREGADAYLPLMLMKGLLLQKWYHIDSDPELENQINDRISFKKFMGLSFDQHSPDHSTFSRFRGRLSKEAMHLINRTVLQQFAQQGLTINEGVAVDARLVQSASHPISTEEINRQREKRETPEGKRDKNGNLPRCVAASCHTEEPIGKVYADKGYYGKPNSGFLSMNHIADGIMRKGTRSTKLTDYEKERNKEIAKKRYIVEQYFGLSHLHSHAFHARFTRIGKNIIDTLFRQMAFNLFRGGRILGTV